MGSKGSAPEPPDPRETSQAQTGTSVATAIANASLGNVNQVTPDGTLTYNQSGTHKFHDPYTGQTYNIPTYTATQTLSKAQQAIKNKDDAAQLNLATLANNQSGFLNDYMAQPFEYGVGEHEQWAGGLYDDLNSEGNSQAMETLTAQLANRGINVGSEAYNREMANLRESQMDSRNRFMLDSYNTGMNSALTQRNQPINEITALLSGSQVSHPNFVNANTSQIPTTDVAGNINQNYNQQMGIWQQQNANANALMGGLFGLGAAGIYASDIRVKENVELIDTRDDGLGVYRFDYIDGPKDQVGLVAQEVEQVYPDAVLTLNGVKHVDYGKIPGGVA